jgi:PPOX class probable F420-dependent enzyme
MLDLTSDFGTRVVQRLEKEEVIWLTTVTSKGIPLPNPVWFYWDGNNVIVYSMPSSYRIRNIQNNPKVALNLQGVDTMGNNAVILQGDARMNFNYPHLHPEYEKKYRDFITAIDLTMEQLRHRPKYIR